MVASFMNVDRICDILLSSNLISAEQKINHHGNRADSIVKGMLQHSRLKQGISIQ